MMIKSNWFINILFALLTIGPALALGHFIENRRAPLIADVASSADGTPSTGAQLNQANCVRCHRLFNPADLSYGQWVQVIQELPNHFQRGDLRLKDPKQQQLLEAYLLGQGTAP
jgi:mono/diheme cytochrome c family protein